MESQNIIEKVSKEYLRSKNKGKILEKKLSKSLHFQSTPILISSLLLRELGAGQIDIARIQKYKNNKMIELYEVKNSKSPSKIQLNRLKNTQNLISQLLDCEVTLKIFVNSNKTKSDSL